MTNEKKYRSLNEINLEIHYYDGLRYNLDRQIERLISIINNLWDEPETDEELIKAHSKDLVILGNEYEYYCDKLITLHRELSLTQIKTLVENGLNS